MPQSASLSRRRFLQAASAAGLLAALPGARGQSPAPAASPARARNLIFLVSDGMSMGTLTLADLYARTVENRRTHWAQLLGRAGLHTGLMDTASASSHVTDSSAAASAWGGGERVANGFLNITPDGRHTEPILVTARRAGKRTGLVTTARATHATPAGFLANVDSRNNEDDIAQQYLERGLDVCLGGGAKHFLPNRRADKRDLFAKFAEEGYAVVRDTAALRVAPAGRTPLLGIFADDHLPFVIDRQVDASIDAAVPTLAEMTAAALAHLENPAGFVVQIEGGRVDHAAHNNDAGALLREQLAFDEALGVALEFQRTHPDTLLVITTDHANANPGLNGDGRADANLPKLARVRESFDHLLADLTPDMTAEAVQTRLAAATGLPVTLGESEMVVAALHGTFAAPYQSMRAIKPLLGQVLANHLSIGWTGVSHTGDFVLLNAMGPGAAAFTPLERNDHVHRLVCDALGLA